METSAVHSRAAAASHPCDRRRDEREAASERSNVDRIRRRRRPPCRFLEDDPRRDAGDEKSADPKGEQDVFHRSVDVGTRGHPRQPVSLFVKAN
jgi:hypothetical protein